MVRTERHIILKSNILDFLCFRSKNLYNRANYLIKEYYEENKSYLDYYKLYKIIKIEECCKQLPIQTSQQILKLLDKNWKSFFNALKVYRDYPNKFRSKPHPPEYKKLRNIAVFTNQQCTVKKGYLVFPKKSGIPPLKTKVNNIQQVRIIPQPTCYVIEVVYKKQYSLDEALDSNLYLSIDLGINNLATLYSNKSGCCPVLVKGKILKSVNQYYNKMKSIYMSYVGDKGVSNRINKLTHKRNMKIQNYLHHTSRFIINYCVDNGISNIVIGHNEGWKQNVSLGKRNNPNIRFDSFQYLNSTDSVQSRRAWY